MPKTEPKRRGSDATRAAILDAARDVFASEGYAGASIRKVAERADCAHAMIYLHFRDKDDLFYQVSEEHFRQLLGRLRSLPRSLDPLSMIREAFGQVVDYGVAHPNYYHLMVSMRPPHAADADDRGLGRVAEEVYGYLYDTVTRAVERGRVDSNDPRLDTWALLAAAHGAAELHLAYACSADEASNMATRALALMIERLALPRRGPATDTRKIK